MTSQSTGWRAPRTAPSPWTPWTRVRGQTRARSQGPRGPPTPGRSIVMVTGARGYLPPLTTAGATTPKLNNNLIYVNKYSYETNFKFTYISIVIIKQSNFKLILKVLFLFPSVLYYSIKLSSSAQF